MFRQPFLHRPPEPYIPTVAAAPVTSLIAEDKRIDHSVFEDGFNYWKTPEFVLTDRSAGLVYDQKMDLQAFFEEEFYLRDVTYLPSLFVDTPTLLYEIYNTRQVVLETIQSIEDESHYHYKAQYEPNVLTFVQVTPFALVAPDKLDINQFFEEDLDIYYRTSSYIRAIVTIPTIPPIWTKQDDVSTSWAQQADESSIWTQQTDDNSPWTKQ